jgi:head-tail adaptor
MVPKRTPDGSGGNDTEWTEGKTFKAAVVRDNSTEAKKADAAGTVETYTVTVSRAVDLKYHDVFKRLSDGKTFRITSDNAEKKTPGCSALDIAQSTAEAWRLPT